jgi:hypothetical protein
MKSNRDYEKVVAGYLDGSSVLFKMKNGYFYLVRIGEEFVYVLLSPEQLARFDPYIFQDDPKKIPQPALDRAVKLLQTLPAEVSIGRAIKEKPEDL